MSRQDNQVSHKVDVITGDPSNLRTLGRRLNELGMVHSSRICKRAAERMEALETLKRSVA